MPICTVGDTTGVAPYIKDGILYLRPHKGSKKTEHLSTLGILLAAIIWGWAFVFSRRALDAGISPPALAFGRYSIATMMLGLIFFKTLKSNLKLAHWKTGLCLGAILFLGSIMTATGLRSTTPGNAAFIVTAYVVMVPVLWWLYTRQKVTTVVLVACAMCFCGIAILSLDLEDSFRLRSGDAMILLAAFIFANYIVLINKLGRDIHHISLAFMQFVVAAILGFIVFIITDRNFAPFASSQGAFGMLYLGVFSTALGLSLQMAAQKHLPGAKVGILISTESLFGAIASIIVGYDVLSPRMITGGLIMFIAIIMPYVWGQLKGRIKSS